MSNPLFETPLVPIASENDAEVTCRAILDAIGDERPALHVVHVTNTDRPLVILPDVDTHE